MKRKIISVKKLAKKYLTSSKYALNHIDLSINEGSIFGLLGPNGAGKSTFINILAGLVNKTSGEVFVCGVNLDSDPKTVRGNLGIVPQEIMIDPFFTPMEIMDIQAGLYAVEKKNIRNQEILNTLGLGEKADVELRAKLWKSIKELNKKGTTIILTTHYLKEAELLCDEIAVINKGKVIANDTKTNLLKILEEKEVKVEFSNKVKNLPKKIKDFCILKDDQSATLKFNKNEINTAELIKEFINSKIDLKDITTKESDLEDQILNFQISY